MTRTTKKAAAKLNTAIAGAVKRFAPPESLTVDEWADKHRRLSPESSAEAGPWRTKRTPYLEEPMRAFTDPKVHKIVMVAASQVGKSELELNIIGYIIDQDPGSILYVHPTIDDARKFSRLRVAPMIRDSKPLKAKVHDVKAKDSGNTILQKSFPGGMLTLTGSNSASALASTPARYIIGDERDRWATSALILPGDTAITNFEHMRIGIQVQDLYYFLRKAMEKYRWKQKLGVGIIRAYERQRRLEPGEWEYLGLQLAYPEKFWKTASSYCRSNKAWLPEKSVEKLELAVNQEEEKTNFLKTIFGIHL